MNIKTLVAVLFFLGVVAARPAHAAVQVSTISVPASIPAPLNGFSINWTMSGSKSGVGAAVAQLTFYVSGSPDGSTGVAQIDSRQIPLRGSGLGPYLPPVGTQSTFISRTSMRPEAISFFQNVTAACQPSTWYILAVVDTSAPRSTSTSLGSVKAPDFFFTAGTLSPGTINPGGTVNMTFDVFTACPTSRPSQVGIFFTDSSFNLLYQIGTVGVGAGAGTFQLPPTDLPIDPFFGPGSYRIVLVADVDGVIAESNESNNQGAFTLNVVAPLAPTGVGEPATLETKLTLPELLPQAVRSFATGEPADYETVLRAAP